MNRQAQEAGRRADELHQQLIAANQPGNTAQAATPEQPSTQQAPEHTSAGTQEHQGDTWEQKYRVIEGKYRKEVPELHQEIRRLQVGLGDKDREITDLKQKLEAAQFQTAKPSAPVQADANGQYDFDQIEDDHGVELANVLRQMQGTIAALQTENQQLKSAGAQKPQPAQQADAQPANGQPKVDALTKQRIDFVIDLVGGVNEFNRIDNDPNFTAWLDQQDHPAYPESRRDNLQRLFAQGKLNEAAAYFITWDRSVNGSSNAADDLQEHLQPGVNRGGGQVQQGHGKIWTRAEIRELQKQFSVNPKYKTPEGRKQAEELEAEFLVAGMQGRIIGR